MSSRPPGCRAATRKTNATDRSNECVDAMLGPTGNLRAPTLVVGKTVIVGFDQETYEDVLV